MRGFLLFRAENGEIARVEADRSARRALIRLLEDTVPDGTEVLGLVVDLDAVPHLAAVGA